ncbi:hypothetical protein CPIN18021_1303 [Campylobacter pinnipediorum subsp. caledonicus]|uniref:Uncharacterized protein n=1 Tax=Campylobacter pinnipediorum subsp. caledonicus TaxID=1874362 RepID=A0A1S6U9G4_9BACT|nr:hypothetical protein [Campylobacter pinnipediorum]AQW86445.1 hypothetical protein CPIN18020_1254 [Campylobacter pinnipediorum subsp. caledonicus]AQW88097.1 hypothetical protein CPIN18021_1303 [Campylobacter pinnipediorum subsp. caledonicus]OPA71540.1 hypothetical protein BB381_03335 [Campylobacter pinnipediorum subsp. caledonicus]
MSFSIRRIFSNLFLSVVLEGSICMFYGRVFKNGKVVKTLEATFTDIDTENIDDKIIAYVKRQEDAYYAVYISLFYNDNFQGALPTLNKEEFEKYNIKTDDLLTISIDNFSVYADIVAVNKAKNLFGEGSIDLLYSPIALMFHEISKIGISENTSLYLYSMNDSAALAIFSKKKMKFATFFKLDKNDYTVSDESEFNKEDITDIDNLIVKDEEEMSSLDGLTSLDDIIQDEKPKEFEDLGYDINMPESKDVDASVSIFGRDMGMYRYIMSAIKEFYLNPLYDGDFIQDIVVFDSSRTSATFLQYIQTELFVETYVHQVDTLKSMNELMQKEISL